MFDGPDHGIAMAARSCKLMGVARQTTEPLHGTAKSLDDAAVAPH